MPRKKGKNIRMAFDMEAIELELTRIAPLKAVTDAIRASFKFRQIVASIKEVGIIEPPVVVAMKGETGRYLLLDGHMRIEALRILKKTRVLCLVSTDDESFTYNRHINRLSPVQEHVMIRRAIQRGASVDRIASALNVDKYIVTKKKNLLDGICPESVSILKDKMVGDGVFAVLKRMKGFRQIEAASLMAESNIYTLAYARALLAATKKEGLVDPAATKSIKGLDAAQLARMEKEMTLLKSEHQLIVERYAREFMALTFGRGWLAKLLENPKVTRYLLKNHREILLQFEKIVSMKALMNKAEMPVRSKQLVMAA